MTKETKESGFGLIFIVLIASIAIASLWDKVQIISESIHYIFDPTIGKLLDWNLTIGMTLLVIIITIIMTLVQKYGTDQEKLKSLKEEQKIMNEEMKKFKDNPQKVLELQKKQFEFLPIMMKHSMRPIVYTGIPLILLFRWFMDYFSSVSLEGFKFFGFFSWFWYYLVASIIFSIIIRKIFNVH